jgi:AraC-like DNA-binding protein
MSTSTQLFWRNSALTFVELRSTYDSLQRYKPHFHPQLSFGAVISGRTRAVCGEREHLLQEGDLVLVAPHAVHSCNPIARQPRSYHMLYVNEAWCSENVAVFRNKSFASDSCVIRSNLLFAEYLKFVEALPHRGVSEVAAELQRLLTAALASKRTIVAKPQPERLAERIRQALLENIGERVTLDELAHAFGCRKETIIRVFRRAFHITPYAFLSNVRVEQAKQRLQRGEKIADVAADLGFSDQAQLHRTFVSYTASTPGQYRRAHPTPTINIRQ